MGVAVRTLLDFFVEVGHWILKPSVSLASETWMSTFDDGATCLPSGHQCHSCGGMFSEPHECGEKLQLQDSSIWPPTSPNLGSQHNKFADLAELHRLSSSTNFTCSSYRSDEEDGHDSGKHFVSPTSEFSQDVSDVDSISISCSQELHSFKSVNSSPWDSPSRPGDNGDSPRSNKVVNSDKEEQVYSNIPGSGADSEESYYMYDNLSPYRSHVNQNSNKTLDFEDDVRIWYPPPPEDVNDDVENGFFEYNDDDDDDDDNDILSSGVDFTSNCFGSDTFPVREKINDPNNEPLGNAVRRHFTALVLQLMKDENIKFVNEHAIESWLEIVSSLAWQAARFVKPDTRKGGSMDPSNYVKVKCLQSGKPCDSTFIKGVVCSKNVKHKRMVSQHKNPRILLLGGALEYQRISNKLASINTVIEEESDHLKIAVAKIEAHRPNVLLVEKSVSSYAQEYLLAKEISLVLNVKRSNLERISRCTGAQLVPSIDYITSAQLGQCEVFRVDKVVECCESSKKSVKTLMFFEGCPRRLGCTVILRGAFLEELKKVKHVVSLATFAAHRLLLETSFLADEGATLPKFPSKFPSSVPDNIVTADIAMMDTSLFSGPSVRRPTAENNKRNTLCRNHGMQSLCHSSGSSYIYEENLNVSIKPNFHSPTAIHELSGDTSTLYTNNSLDSIGQCKKSSGSNPRNSTTQIGDSLVTDNRSITSTKYLIAADEFARRNDDLEVPEEYFSTADNQSILVSFSSSYIPKGTVCEPPQLLRIKFYGSFDKPLGKYLREDLFDQTSSCRLCNEPVEVHTRCYTHQHGSLMISVRRLTSMKLAGERDGRIWMWHRCLRCEPKDGIPPATRRVVLSDAAWGLSFGKFLELSFSNHATANRLASCGHSLQKDCLRFYGFGNFVAFFRYSPVDILSVYLPPLVLDFSYLAMQEWLKSEAIQILSSLNLLHLEIFNFLEQIELKVSSYDSDPVKAIIHKKILILKDVLQRDRNEYDVLLKPASTEPSQGILDILELNQLKRRLLIDSVVWDRRLCLLDSFTKSESSNTNVHPQVLDDFTQDGQTALRTEAIFRDEGLISSSDESATSSRVYSENWNIKQHEEFNMQVLECNTSNLVEVDLSIETVEGYVGAAGLNLVSGHCYRGYVGQIDCDGRADTTYSRSIMSPVSNLSDRIDFAWTGSSHSLDQLTSNETDSSVGPLSLMNSPRYRNLISPVRVSSFDSALRLRNKLHRGLSPLSLRFSSVKSFDTSRVSDGMVSIPCTHHSFFYKSPSSLKRLNFLASHIPVFISSVSCIASEGARLLIPQGRHVDVVIALYDNEPTSIISYAISSQEYANFLSTRNNQCEMNSKDDKAIAGLSNSSVSQYQTVDTQHWNCSSNESKPLHGIRTVDHKELHFKFSFDDDYSIKGDRVKFSVTCYFAKQFDALRKKCCMNDLDFIRSLSRCKKWSAQGGKSNVYFAKSLDERFIIKQVTRTELDSFEDFAPEYFNYLTESINSGSPTCLAKVLGIYQVTVKHVKGGREVKMDLVVMENLLYGRNVSRIYDLKGSSRARYNPDTSGTNKVLLDLNLLETLQTKPILLSSKAKRKLERAIWNDTSFLASIDVMDYSLLVGIDEGKKDLVIGIIDYMRQYTWDKHLETWVKASGILGKNSSPTVVSPLQYKKRFRKAMSKYFLTVPDQWSS